MFLKQLFEAALANVALGENPTPEAKALHLMVNNQIGLVELAFKELKSVRTDIEALRLEGGNFFQGTGGCEWGHEDCSVTLEWPNLAIDSDAIANLLESAASMGDATTPPEKVVPGPTYQPTGKILAFQDLSVGTMFIDHFDVGDTWLKTSPYMAKLESGREYGPNYGREGWECDVSPKSLTEPVLSIWYVLYGSEGEFFKAAADDREHAMEQCRDAYPGETVHVAVPADKFGNLVMYAYGEEMVTCPKCGRRTEMGELPVGDGMQIHVCHACDHSFIAVPDEDDDLDVLVGDRELMLKSMAVGEEVTA